MGLWFILEKNVSGRKNWQITEEKNVTFNKNTKKIVPGGKHVSIFEHRNTENPRTYVEAITYKIVNFWETRMGSNPAHGRCDRIQSKKTRNVSFHMEGRGSLRTSPMQTDGNKIAITAERGVNH